MAIRTTMIKPGVWEVVDIGNMYMYRVCSGCQRIWTIFKKRRETVDMVLLNELTKWEYVETGYKSKASAVEYVEELAQREEFNPYADLLNNIDDGIDLNEEGRN